MPQLHPRAGQGVRSNRLGPPPCATLRAWSSSCLVGFGGGYSLRLSTGYLGSCNTLYSVTMGPAKSCLRLVFLRGWKRRNISPTSRSQLKLVRGRCTARLIGTRCWRARGRARRRTPGRLFLSLPASTATTTLLRCRLLMPHLHRRPLKALPDGTAVPAGSWPPHPALCGVWLRRRC